MLSDGYKFKTCYDMMKPTIHSPSTEVESVALLCPGDQLPPSCGPHKVILDVGLMLCLIYPLLVVVDVDMVILPGVHSGPETEGDAPHTSHGNCEHS